MTKTFSNTIRIFVFTLLVFANHDPSFSKGFQTFHNARLVQANDGDSFLVDIGEEVIHIRLYFVDCPETKVSSRSDARRVREQTRYFGLTSAENTVLFGNEATGLVKRELSRPFTVHTAFANALGRSSKRRIYGLINTEDGSDLGALLVKNGLCRPYGVGRKTPDGISKDEMFKKLQDLKDEAMLKRVGIWSRSDPNQIAKLRESQRSEDKELKQLTTELNKPAVHQNLIDLNTASKEQLQSVKGIGPVLAERIILGRPYKNVDELIRVKGIGSKSILKIEPYFLVGEP